MLTGNACVYTLGMTQDTQNDRAANISTAIALITTGTEPDETTIGVIVETLAASIPGSDHITPELVRVAAEMRRVEDLMDNTSARIRQWRAYLPASINHMVDGFAVIVDNYAGAIGTPESQIYHQEMVCGHQAILAELSRRGIVTHVYRPLRRAILEQAFFVREHRRLLERLSLVVSELESMAV